MDDDTLKECNEELYRQDSDANQKPEEQRSDMVVIRMVG